MDPFLNNVQPVVGDNCRTTAMRTVMTRYLGTYIVAGREFRCSITHAKRSFHRSINVIFGKVGRLASEEVTLQLAKSKCIYQS